MQCFIFFLTSLVAPLSSRDWLVSVKLLSSEGFLQVPGSHCHFVAVELAIGLCCSLLFVYLFILKEVTPGCALEEWKGKQGRRKTCKGWILTLAGRAGEFRDSPDEMPYWVKHLLSKPNDLSWITETYMWKGTTHWWKSSCHLCTDAMAQVIRTIKW